MSSGIYQIRNLINNKIYVGSTKSLSTRKYIHFHLLRKNEHRNRHLQSAFNKYGENNFVFEVLITCHLDTLLWYEQQFLDQWKPEYNVLPTAGSPLGYKHPKEFGEQIRQRKLGKTTSDATKKKIGDALRGIPLSDSTKKKISAAKKGGSNGRIGYVTSQSTKDKIQKARMGHITLDSTKELVRKKLKGRPNNTLAKLCKGFISPSGDEYKDVFNLSEFCRQHKLSQGLMNMVSLGKRNHHKGWILMKEQTTVDFKIKPNEIESG